MVIGTDSLASNQQLNILEEIKTIQLTTIPIIPLSTLLRWATINGAKALQLDHLVGSFEKGKTPGIVLIENIEQFQLTQQSTSRRIL
jgi:cytosine/adenosine deaminase-related metal-dependent hydrolase